MEDRRLQFWQQHQRSPRYAMRLPVAGRGQSLLSAARIPRRYEHCNSPTTYRFSRRPSVVGGRSLYRVRLCEKMRSTRRQRAADNWQDRNWQDPSGVGIIKELIVNQVSLAFLRHRELLKEIQNSYNSTVQTTELDVLRPVFETDVLVLDELGAVKPTEWVWDTVSLILKHAL